jgi:TPR repeat protein
LQCSAPPAFDQKSVIVFEQQAADGDAAAQCGLGDLYSGVPQDNTQAVLCRVLGHAAPADCHGVPQDNTQAVFWYRKSAEQGDAEAQSRLGEAYRLGRGVLQDYAQAVFWTRKAAEQGDAPAQANLGMEYGAGLGVPRDFAEAYFWLDVATTAGKLDASDMELAAKVRDANASMLTPADLSREQERARKWFEAHQAKPK